MNKCNRRTDIEQWPHQLRLSLGCSASRAISTPGAAMWNPDSATALVVRVHHKGAWSKAIRVPLPGVAAPDPNGGKGLPQFLGTNRNACYTGPLLLTNYPGKGPKTV